MQTKKPNIFDKAKRVLVTFFSNLSSSKGVLREGDRMSEQKANEKRWIREFMAALDRDAKEAVNDPILEELKASKAKPMSEAEMKLRFANNQKFITDRVKNAPPIR